MPPIHPFSAAFASSPPDPQEPHDDHGGLVRDARMDRRRALQVLGAVGLGGVLAACSSGGDGTASSTTTGDGATAADSSVEASDASGPGAEIPEETAGPFPADGSNGPNVLTDGAAVRADLTTSFGDLSGTADGVPMTIELTVVDAATGAARPGAAVYAWHCTADGRYSLYEIEDQNYLRGLQAADDAGRITFQTIFPGCYAGRWPHVHFEVFPSVDDADAGSDATTTSQLALPEAACAEVYADGRYAASATNLGRLSLDTDGVFAEGWSDQLATVTGSVDGGMVASLLVRT